MDHDDISCKQFIRTLADYLAGELGAAAARRSESHRRDCPDCARYLRDYLATMRLARESAKDDDETLPADLARDILSARRRRN